MSVVFAESAGITRVLVQMGSISNVFDNVVDAKDQLRLVATFVVGAGSVPRDEPLPLVTGAVVRSMAAAVQQTAAYRVAQPVLELDVSSVGVSADSRDRNASSALPAVNATMDLQSRLSCARDIDIDIENGLRAGGAGGWLMEMRTISE